MYVILIFPYFSKANGANVFTVMTQDPKGQGGVSKKAAIFIKLWYEESRREHLLTELQKKK